MVESNLAKDSKMDGFAPANYNFNSPKNIVPHNFSNRPVTRSQVQVKLAASNVDAGASKVIHSKQKTLQKQKKPKSSASKSNNELVDQEQPSTLKHRNTHTHRKPLRKADSNASNSDDELVDQEQPSTLKHRNTHTHRKPLRKADSNASNSDDKLVDQEQPSTSKITQRKPLRKTDSNASNSDDESMDQEKPSTVSEAPKMVRFALAHRNFNSLHNIELQAFTNRPVTRSQGQMKLPPNNVTVQKADSNAVIHLKQKTLQKQKKSKSSASHSNKKLVDQEKPSTVSAAPKMVTFVSPPKNIEPQIVTNRPVTRSRVQMTLPAMDQKSPLAVSEVPVITRPTRKRSQKPILLCETNLRPQKIRVELNSCDETERLVGNKPSTSSSTRSKQKNLKESQEVAIAEETDSEIELITSQKPEQRNLQRSQEEITKNKISRDSDSDQDVTTAENSCATLERADMTPCIPLSRGKDNQKNLKKLQEVAIASAKETDSEIELFTSQKPEQRNLQRSQEEITKNKISRDSDSDQDVTTAENSCSILEPAHMTSCILLSRGKDNQRKEYYCKKKLTLDADTTSFNSLETLNNVLSSTTPDVEAVAGYFTRILNNTISDLEKLCDQWRLYRKERAIREACNMIDVVIGQSQLLIHNNFELFRTLINQYQTKENTKKITCEDLHGVWDMLLIQIGNLQKRFNNLSTIRNNNWREMLPEQQAKKRLKRKTAKAKGASSCVRNAILKA